MFHQSSFINQDHSALFPLLDAMTQVAKVLAGLPNIIGFGTMNEPLPG